MDPIRSLLESLTASPDPRQRRAAEQVRVAVGGAAPAHCPFTALSSPRLLPTVQEALYSQNSHAGEISCGHIMAQWVPRHVCACCCVVAAPLPAFALRGSLKVLKEEAVDEDAAAALCWGPSQQTLLQPSAGDPASRRCS